MIITYPITIILDFISHTITDAIEESKMIEGRVDEVEAKFIMKKESLINKVSDFFAFTDQFNLNDFYDNKLSKASWFQIFDQLDVEKLLYMRHNIFQLVL